MTRWEILEIIERDGVLERATLYRPLGELADGPDYYPLPFTPENNTRQLISAVLFDGYEPVSQAVTLLPGGVVQKHWTFRQQVMT